MWIRMKLRIGRVRTVKYCLFNICTKRFFANREKGEGRVWLQQSCSFYLPSFMWVIVTGLCRLLHTYTINSRWHYNYGDESVNGEYCLINICTRRFSGKGGCVCVSCCKRGCSVTLQPPLLFAISFSLLQMLEYDETEKMLLQNDFLQTNGVPCTSMYIQFSCVHLSIIAWILKWCLIS